MDDDILKNEDELNEDIIDVEKKKIDPLANPLDEAESIEEAVDDELAIDKEDLMDDIEEM
ncbi:MAG: hypothetical protein Q7R89_00895 [bacterium]|nr:hypothetical protein [bacterium]